MCNIDIIANDWCTSNIKCNEGKGDARERKGDKEGEGNYRGIILMVTVMTVTGKGYRTTDMKGN